MRLVMLLFVVLLASSVVTSQEPTDDRNAILGTWVLVAFEFGGRSETLAAGKPPLEWTFGEGRFQMRRNNEQLLAGTYKVDPTPMPKEITMTSETPGVKFYGLGIYRLAGDDLVVTSGDPRPKEFKTKEGERRFVFTLKRAKKKPGPQGRWRSARPPCTLASWSPNVHQWSGSSFRFFSDYSGS